MGNIKTRVGSHGMKAGILLQYSEDQIKLADDITHFVRKEFDKEKRKLLIKDSVRVLKWSMRHGHNGDDFINNLYSIVFTGRSYKVPRIVKNMLLK
jgi:hypothetical protein